MDGKTFAKMCKEVKFLDKKLTPTDVDLIFAKIKDKSERKITFQQFGKGCELIADKKGISLQQVKDIIASGEYVLTGTKAEKVKFHDDKSLYTGVYAQGGPTNVGGTGAANDLSSLLDRSDADVRGIKKDHELH